MQNFAFGQKSFVKFKQVRQNIQWNMIPKNMVQESQCWGEPILLLEAFRTWIPDLDNVRWQKRWAGAKDHLYEVLCINYNNKFQTRLLGPRKSMLRWADLTPWGMSYVDPRFRQCTMTKTLSWSKRPFIRGTLYKLQ